MLFPQAKHTSPWKEVLPQPLQDYNAPKNDTTVDVCIIGAGIAGLTSAYCLAREGYSVALVESRTIGGGESGVTTAHLVDAHDDRYYKLEHWHGEEKTKLIADSHRKAIHFIAQTVENEHIDCDFEWLDGYLFLGDEQRVTELKKELEAATRAGVKGLEFILDLEVCHHSWGPALRFPKQGQFHLGKYLRGLATILEQLKQPLYMNTAVIDLIGDRPPYTIKTNRDVTITAEYVIQATNSPLFAPVTFYTKQAPYRTYVIGIAVDTGTLPHSLWWDTLDPYHYIRLQSLSDTEDLLLIGGEDHRAGTANDAKDRYHALEGWARTHFFALKDVRYYWSGQVQETLDGAAHIGEHADKPGVYFITGDSGMGMTHGTIGGMLTRDLIVTGESPWAEVYDPNRTPYKRVGEYVAENVPVIKNFAHRFLSPERAKSEEEVPNGSGAIIREGKKKVAVFRDDKGTVYKKSAACTHVKCEIQWNDDVKSWDCPCHGSRFDGKGDVLTAPAYTPLDDVE